MTSILDMAQPVSTTVESINMVLYGDPGSGKTVFAGSGRDNGKHDLIVAIEQGTKSAARMGSQASVIDVRDWETLEKIVDAVIDEADRYEWVIIDSLTKMQDIIWKEIIENSTAKTPSRSKYKKELQEYGEAQERIKDIVRRLNESEANIIYTAMADIAVDEEANEYRLPALHGGQGAVAWWVCGEVDVVCYLDVIQKNGKPVRRFQFNKTNKAITKDRMHLYDKAQGELTLAKYTEDVLNSSENKEPETENKDSKESAE